MAIIIGEVIEKCEYSIILKIIMFYIYWGGLMRDKNILLKKLPSVDHIINSKRVRNCLLFTQKKLLRMQ